MIAGGEVTRGDKAEELKASFEKVLAYMTGDVPGEADRAALLLEEMLLEYSLQLQGSRRPWQQEAMPLIREALNACIYEKPDLPRIAEDLHLSMSTLRRTVRRSSGYPLHEYIHRLKMAEAKHLLLNTSLQVQEIAGMLHYRDSFYFSRLFKKYMGLSPQICRNHI